MSKFYITTTLPYVNANPHIGFALEIVQADAIARYQKEIIGNEVFFNTGTDEHGLKIYREAKKAKLPPQKYVDSYAVKFDNLKKALNLSYNAFIRTTDKHHVKAAQEFWKRCDANGDLYKKNYKINYCVGCELEKTNSELVEGKCEIHPKLKLEIIEEENYFFRFSKYQKQLLKIYKDADDKAAQYIVPASRLNEIKKFTQNGLEDFSVSRLKSKMPWGVPVPGDNDHVMYVWFDALINYISTLGWPKPGKFEQFWPGMQVAGKDNLRQQTAMWQAMLLSAGLPLTKRFLIHGFIYTKGEKMSKSDGNVVDPFALVNKYGTDAIRYYLLRYVHPVQDSDFTIAKLEKAYTADLANGLGNLVSRVTGLIEQNNVKLKAIKLSGAKKRENKTFVGLDKHFLFNSSVGYIWTIIADLDAVISKNKPWELAKKGKIKDLENILSESVAYMVEISHLLKPFMPETAEKIEKIFLAKNIKKVKPLFPRLN